MNSIKYCKHCAITKENMKGSVSKENADYGAGYLIGYDNNISQCPFCNELLIDVPISEDDFLCLRKVSNYDRNFLQAMIDLKEKDIIEYNLKLSQFKTQLEQQKNKEIYNNTIPRCPHCHNTDIQKISGLERAGSIAVLGIFSKKINKSFKCKQCGYTW